MPRYTPDDLAVAMIMKWDAVTTAQYDDVREPVGWESDVPRGTQFHVVTHDGSALRVTDVWDSEEHRPVSRTGAVTTLAPSTGPSSAVY